MVYGLVPLAGAAPPAGAPTAAPVAAPAASAASASPQQLGHQAVAVQQPVAPQPAQAVHQVVDGLYEDAPEPR